MPGSVPLTGKAGESRASPVDMALLPIRMLPQRRDPHLPQLRHWVMIKQQEAWEAAVLAFLRR